tara:strand:- start:993 stop:1370 length:378 start_codon:yes stop_codon:yes gene_type:complete
MPVKRSTLIKKLDKVFSQYIRLKDADHAGYVNCFTCGVSKNWREVDAGHFQSRGKYATRWNEDNVKPQCKRCNGFRGGEQYQFALNLGTDLADELVYLSNQPARLTNEWLLEKIKHYQQEVKKLL